MEKKELKSKKKCKSTDLTVVEKKPEIFDNWTSEEIELVKSQVAVGTTNEQLKLFLYHAHKTGLDPLSRQIHCVLRKCKQFDPQTQSWGYANKMAIQTGIDGYRVIAGRTGELAGIDDAIFVEGSTGIPEKASVTVYRMVHGHRCPFTASARWKEYFPGERAGKMWLKMPHLMLAKVAEALALRKAFPQDLSGVYTDAEMDQADKQTNGSNLSQNSTSEAIEVKSGNTTPLPQQQELVDPNIPIDEESILEIRRLQSEKGYSEQNLIAGLMAYYKLDKLEKLNMNQAKDLIERLSKK